MTDTYTEKQIAKYRYNIHIQITYIISVITNLPEDRKQASKGEKKGKFACLKYKQWEVHGCQ